MVADALAGRRTRGGGVVELARSVVARVNDEEDGVRGGAVAWCREREDLAVAVNLKVADGNGCASLQVRRRDGAVEKLRGGCCAMEEDGVGTGAAMAAA